MNKKYEPPACRVGDWLDDEIFGRVQVGGFTATKISWPYRKKTGSHSLILCGDLIEAVKNEAAQDICDWFGVGVTTVAKWRRTLGVDRQNNAGTQRLYKELMPKKITPESAAIGRENAKSPFSRAKMAATKRDKPAHPNTKRALLEAAKRPKSEEWKRKASERQKGKTRRPDSQPELNYRIKMLQKHTKDMISFLGNEDEEE
jgi:hypothetical protein